MTKDDFASLQQRVFEELKNLRKAGQKEYAGGEDAFGNFNRLSDRLGISREKVLWVYFVKHLDGIESYMNGHKSQRENVRGRINDAMVYLTLLRGMIEENESKIDPKNVESYSVVDDTLKRI